MVIQEKLECFSMGLLLTEKRLIYLKEKRRLRRTAFRWTWRREAFRGSVNRDEGRCRLSSLDRLCSPRAERTRSFDRV